MKGVILPRVRPNFGGQLRDEVKVCRLVEVLELEPANVRDIPFPTSLLLACLLAAELALGEVGSIIFVLTRVKKSIDIADSKTTGLAGYLVLI